MGMAGTHPEADAEAGTTRTRPEAGLEDEAAAEPAAGAAVGEQRAYDGQQTAGSRNG